MQQHEDSTVPGPSACTQARRREAISRAFTRLEVSQRIRVLRRLLVPVGPLALAVLADGVFTEYMEQARSPRIRLAPEDAARVTPAQVLELARYAEQSRPSALQQAMRIVARASRCDALLVHQV
jgi:hypothetical protein